MRLGITARKYFLATLAAAVIYVSVGLIDTELIEHHLRAEARYLDYFVLALVAFVFVMVLEDFHERESLRLREVQRLVADMNHHVRNALQVISYANSTNADGKFTEQVRDSVERIDWALREVLGEHAVRLGAQPIARASDVEPGSWTTEQRATSTPTELRVKLSDEKSPR